MRGDGQMSIECWTESNGGKLIWNFFGKNFVELFGVFCKSHTTQLNRFSAPFLFPWRDEAQGFLLPISLFHSLILSLIFISQGCCGREQQRQ